MLPRLFNGEIITGESFNVTTQTHHFNWGEDAEGLFWFIDNGEDSASYRYTRRWRRSNETALAEQGFRCFHCERRGSVEADPDGRAWERDHLMPRSLGGLNHPINIVISCASCNARKKDHVPRFIVVWATNDESAGDEGYLTL